MNELFLGKGLKTIKNAQAKDKVFQCFYLAVQFKRHCGEYILIKIEDFVPIESFVPHSSKTRKQIGWTPPCGSKLTFRNYQWKLELY